MRTNQYHDCKDANSYLCGDEINDVISFPYEKTNRLVPVLACEDSSLRVLDRSKVMHTVEIDSSPTVLHLYRNDGGDTGDRVLYGTVDGRVGVLQVGRTGVRNRWLVNNELHRGGILCMDCYDITGDGMMDLLIGRQDGSIEVYSIEDDGEDEDGKETRKFGFTCNESVTSIQGGIFGSSGCDEILATTYTGFMFGLTSHKTTETKASIAFISDRIENLRAAGVGHPVESPVTRTSKWEGWRRRRKESWQHGCRDGR
uniref:BBS7 beta-propeller domain-containing protein n=1 Tax=Timema cristinae TaxID=61476 RepID=A0A7R9H0B2_TIMCR|nr:unnamed protein product [Timema cristinae]